MPRKVARQRNYDIPFVGSGLAPVTLGPRERAEVTRILRRSPSPEFMRAYSFMLANYIAHRSAVTNSSPAAVQKRIGAVVRATKTLQKSLRSLSLTERMLIGRLELQRFFRKERCTTLDELYRAIADFLPVMEDALARVATEEKRGRMPAFAERALASGLCQILYEELGAIPKPTKKVKWQSTAKKQKQMKKEKEKN